MPVGLLILGTGFMAFYYVLPLFKPTVLATALTSLVFPLLATGAVLTGVKIRRPVHRSPWLVLAAAEGCNLLGDVAGVVQRNVFHIDQYPSIADVFYLLAYPMIGVALVMFVRRRTPGVQIPALIDSAMLSIAAGLLWWLYLVSPMTGATGSTLQRVVAVAYPVMDLLLLAVAL